jgi:phosphomannomutase
MSTTRQAAADWLARDPDPATRAALAALLDAGDDGALARLFDGRIGFGTAGLRAPMGPGPRRMNRLVVRECAAGVARWLLADRPAEAARGVVVANDARHRSADFAADLAEVVAAHGIPVHHLEGPWPTPVAAFAVRHAGAAAGLVVTASHNPAADNGVKVYLGDGAQIAPPVDAAIAACIDAVAADGVLLPGGPPAAVTPLGPEVPEAYRRAVLALVPPAAGPLRIATTAMHGVGGATLARVLGEAGFTDVHPVAGQERPDPDFPTVPSPNPEESGATDLLAARMRETGAALGLALDPDADRLAVLVPGEDGAPVRLTGDEVGALLGWWLLAEVTAGPGRLVVSTVVSSSLLPRIAEAQGVRHVTTPTGFKWLARPAIEHPEWTQVLAYEEALGYAVGPAMRDKDGIAAALAVASMTAACAARGLTLRRILDGIHRRHGMHVGRTLVIRDAGDDAPARWASRMDGLVREPPADLGGHAVLGAGQVDGGVVRLDLADDVRAMVRPSGTEPVLKCYLEAVVPVRSGDLARARERCEARLADVGPALEALLRD